MFQGWSGCDSTKGCCCLNLSLGDRDRSSPGITFQHNITHSHLARGGCNIFLKRNRVSYKIDSLDVFSVFFGLFEPCYRAFKLQANAQVCPEILMSFRGWTYSSRFFYLRSSVSVLRNLGESNMVETYTHSPPTNFIVHKKYSK